MGERLHKRETTRCFLHLFSKKGLMTYVPYNMPQV